MSEAEVINYMRQICEGVKQMHEKNIIHLGKLTLETKELNYLEWVSWVLKASYCVKQKSLKTLENKII